MPTQQELENLQTTTLAVLCGKVVNDPKYYSQASADKALELKKEWAILQTPTRPSLKDQRQKEAQLLALHKRMAEFLAGVL